MRYLIDTNIISELRKGSRANTSVQRWFQSVDAQDLFLSVLTVGEIRKGIESVRPMDPRQAEALETWLDRLNTEFLGRVVLVDEAVAVEWGYHCSLRSLPVVDGLLAATGRVHDLTLVTRNTRDLQGMPVQLLNPFEQVVSVQEES